MKSFACTGKSVARRDKSSGSDEDCPQAIKSKFYGVLRRSEVSSEGWG